LSALARADPRVWAGVAGAAALGCIFWAATWRGIWLDEFWSLYLGRADVGRADWTRDTHPWAANLLYWTVTVSGVEEIGARRLALNLPAFVLIAATLVVFARHARLFPIVLLLVVIGLPDFVPSFADYRTYGWQIAGVFALLCYAHWLADVPAPSGRLQHLIGSTGVIASIGLHYVGGLVASVFVALLVSWLWIRGQRRHAIRLGLVAMAVWTITLVSAVALLRGMAQSIDHGWIKTSTGVALALFALVSVQALLANLVATASALLGRPKLGAFAALLMGAIVGGLLLLVAINLATPVVVQRYLIGWQVLVCGLVAMLAVPLLDQRKWLLAPAALAALGSLAINTREALTQTGWTDNLGWIADEQRACPASKVYAVSAQRLTVIKDTKLSAREGALIGDAYRSLAMNEDVAVEVLPHTGRSTLAPPGACPTLLWIEHLDWAYVGDVPRLLRIGQFDLARPYTATVRTSPSGFVVKFAR